MGKHGDAMRLYSGREMKDRARMWVRLHKRMSDYLQQAPILVLAEDDPDTRLMLHRACERGAKLREVMEGCGFNVGLRKVHPFALRRFEPPPPFVSANPSAIAQQIASRSIDGQREYLKQMGVYAAAKRNFARDCGVPVDWMAENLPKGSHDMRHYADIPAEMLMECGYRRNWRWRDFKAAMKRWEDSYSSPNSIINRVFQRLGSTDDHMIDAMMYGQRMYMTNAEGQRQVVQWGDAYEPFKRTHVLSSPLTPHKEAPTEATDCGLSFHLLNTPIDLAEEGQAMQHCVGGYSANVKSGRSLIYSIRKDGKRLATMELAPSEWGAKTGGPQEVTGWHISQVKAVKNATPEAHILLAARAFAEAHFRMVDLKPMSWEVPFREMRVIRPDMRFFGDAPA